MRSEDEVGHGMWGGVPKIRGLRVWGLGIGFRLRIQVLGLRDRVRV